MYKKILAVVVVLVLGGVMLWTDVPSHLKTSLIPNKNISMATLKTNMGDITIQLYTEKVPGIAGNFIELAKAGKYDDTIFHRVIEGFMIQGGDYENKNGTGGQSAKGGMIPDEFSEGLSNVRGAISMANRGPDTNGSQFFIVHKDATFLDGRHSVFGQVIDGMDVVDAIATTKTGMGDRPVKDMVIESVELQ